MFLYMISDTRGRQATLAGQGNAGKAGGHSLVKGKLGNQAAMVWTMVRR